MKQTGIHMAQSEGQDTGKLQVQVVTSGQRRPVPEARVSISYTGDPGAPIEELKTDKDGRTQEVDLPAPPVEYSMEPEADQIGRAHV